MFNFKIEFEIIIDFYGIALCRFPLITNGKKGKQNALEYFANAIR